MMPRDSITDARIRELMLINLFAVFNERDPERRRPYRGEG
jgi:hypothetical protein